MVNSEKLKNLILYVTEKCEKLPNVGKTLLYKILYFSDFDYYELHEQSITGEKYYKLEHGPAPGHFDKAIKELEEEGDIQFVDVPAGSYTTKKIIPLTSPELDDFNANEIKIVDRVIERLSSMTAKQVSAYSHGDMPWKATEMNEEIDYELVFYRNDVYSVSNDEDVNGDNRTSTVSKRL